MDKNGNGKDYFSCFSYFEGEYVYGKIWNGKILFKGEEYELRNGNGFVKKYEDYFGFYDSIIFEGEYKNGEKNGGTKIEDNVNIKKKK